MSVWLAIAPAALGILAVGGCSPAATPSTHEPPAGPVAPAPAPAAEEDPLAVLAAVESGRAAPAALTPRHLRQLGALRSEAVAARLEAAWGRVGGPPVPQIAAQVDRVLAAAATPGADAAEGARLFARTCARCHRLGAGGAGVGPPLDGALGGDVGEIARALVNPNELVPRAYFSTGLLLDDGGFPQGIVARQDDREVVLRREEGKEEAIPRTRIRQIIPSGVSYMPEGLLADYSRDQIRDLIAYLLQPAR